MLFMDLFFVIKNPFAPQMKRLNKLKILAIIIASAITLVTVVITVNPIISEYVGLINFWVF